jgi:hypothetical protein
MSDLIEGPIYKAMQAGRFPVLVSLARHEIDLARAALDSGAFGLKIHLNAYHRASGASFGSFAEELPFIERLAALGAPLMVMSGQETQPTPDELRRLEDFGFESFNVYLKHAQPHLFDSRLRPTLALDDTSTDAEIDEIAAIPGAMLEVSITRFADYGKPLDADDLARYAAIISRARLPAIAPSQKRFTADDMAPLRAAGAQAVLVGSVVTGTDARSLAAALRPITRAAAV